MNDWEGLTADEVAILEFGGVPDQVRWCASMILDLNPIISNRANVYKAVGAVLKRHGFKSVAMASRHLTELTDESLFPKLNYACASYTSAQKAKEVGERTAQSVGKILENTAQNQNLAKKRKLLADPVNGVVELFCDGLISKEELDKVKLSADLSAELIRKVMG